MESTLDPSVRPSPLGKELARISGSHRLSALYAFGSRAKEVAALVGQESRGLLETGRDVDVAVLPDARGILSVREKVELAQELEELFGSARVDLVVLPEADPFLSANAVRGERIYCRDDYAADEYELYVLRRAGDLVPFERERIRMILEVKDEPG